LQISDCRLRIGAALVVALALSGAACASHHTTTGLVLRVNQPGATVTISHDAFPGYMDAMAMPFDLKGSARAAKLTAGDRVRFRLTVKGGHSWVDRVEVVSG
jgi:Cu/Ag efflux protein CusF